MCVLLDLERANCDIHTAYLQAKCLKGEECPVRMPKGERTWRKVLQVDGSYKKMEEFGVARRYIYGLPNSDRRYAQMLNRFLMEIFNRAGWRCVKSTKDPCLYVLQYPRSKFREAKYI